MSVHRDDILQVNYLSRIRKLVNAHYTQLMSVYNVEESNAVVVVELDADWTAVDHLLHLVKAAGRCHDFVLLNGMSNAGKLAVRMAELDQLLQPTAVQMRATIERHHHTLGDTPDKVPRLWDGCEASATQIARRRTTSTCEHGLSSFERVLLGETLIVTQAVAFLAHVSVAHLPSISGGHGGQLDAGVHDARTRHAHVRDEGVEALCARLCRDGARARRLHPAGTRCSAIWRNHAR